MVSKSIEKLTEGKFVSEDFSYRDRFRAYFRSKGKIKLTEPERLHIEKIEAVQELMITNRRDPKAMKLMIREKFDLKHREEIDRLIEDATYLFGAGYLMEKSYQRMIQLNDIEDGLTLAKTTKDNKLYADMIAERRKLYQLDQPDTVEEFDYFERVTIQLVFKPEKFLHALPADYMDTVKKLQLTAMKDCGLITDITDAEFSK